MILPEDLVPSDSNLKQTHLSFIEGDWPKTHFCLILPALCLLESYVQIKNNLNFCFPFSFRSLKRFYDLWKVSLTFWSNRKKCENKIFSLVFSLCLLGREWWKWSFFIVTQNGIQIILLHKIYKKKHGWNLASFSLQICIAMISLV